MGRTLALLLTTAAGVGVLVGVDDEAVTAAGTAAALVCLASIWLASGKPRLVLALGAAVAWAGTVVLSVGDPLAMLASLAGLIAAGLTVAKGSQWPGWSSRYARSTRITDDETSNPRTMWESLDRGVDPTADASSDT
jgi:hypothetical protein